MNPALLLIDLQNDYFPGGAMELPASSEAGNRAAALLGAFRRRGLPVIHIQHLATRPGATFFLPGTPGAAIQPGLQPEDGEAHFTKHFPNSFRETPLLEHLQERGVKVLVIAGMMTQMCIDTTTRAAADLGFACRLAHDACAAQAQTFGGITVPAQQVHAAFLAALQGAFAQVSSVDEILAAL
jgi:nicotinamidase-related amidase